MAEIFKLTCLSQAATLQDDPSAKSASIDSTANQDPPLVPQLNPYGINSNGDGFGQSEDAARKRYLDSLAGHIIKRGETKRFLESIATDIISAYPQHKRFLDEIAGNIIRKDADKRYLDSIAGNLIRRGDGNEFLNLPGHPLSSDYAGDYPNLPDIAFDIAYPYLPNSEFGNSLSDGQSYDDVFNAEGFLQDSGDYVWQGNKDHEALPVEIPERAKVFKFNDSFQYLPQGQKRYIDAIGGNLIKKHAFDFGLDKRYLDSLGSSLIKRNPGLAEEDLSDQQKRYIDSLGSSLIKRLHSDEDSDERRLHYMKRNANFQPDIPYSVQQFEENKRYIDSLGSSLIKKKDEGLSDNEGSNSKRYIDSLGSSLIKKNTLDHESNKRYLDSLGSSLIKKSSDMEEAQSEMESMDTDKRYIDSLGSSLIKKKDQDDSDAAYAGNNKRYIDSLGSSLIKKSENHEDDKRYIDSLGSSLIKKNVEEENSESSISEDKRYIDSLGSSLIKKNVDESESSLTENKRYLDSLGSSLIKKESSESLQEKRYLDGIGSSLLKREDDRDVLEDDLLQMGKEDSVQKRYLDEIGSSLIKKDDGEKRYLDGIGSSLLKKDSENKRYLDGIGSSLLKRKFGQKRYLDGIGSSLLKRRQGLAQKRYLDSLGSSLIKRPNSEKRYLDDIGSSLIKRPNFEKRYLDDIGSSLIKRPESEKRYIDSLGSSLIKRPESEKRYIDSLGSSLIKRPESEKRYIDSLGSSLIKRPESEKRYIDSLGSSLIKRPESEKRYIDSLGSSLIKRPESEKRYIDSLGSSLIKRPESEKRYIDSLGSSLIKRPESEKRYIDSLGSSLIKRPESEKRYIDSLGSSLIKRPESEKRYIDSLGSSLIKRPESEKRYFDSLGSSLIKRPESEKRYIDSLGSSLIKRPESEKRYIDNLGSSLIKKTESEKRYIDSLGSSLIKRPESEKRYLDDIGSSLIKKDQGEKRYLDSVGSGLIKKESSSSQDTAMQDAAEDSSRHTKRMMEVTDDVMDGSKEAAEAEAEADVKEAEVKETEEDGKDAEDKGDAPAAKSRRKRDVSLLFAKHRSQTRAQRKKRFIDEIASNVLYKRFGYPGSLHRTNQRDQQSEERSQEYKYGTYSSGKDLLQDRLQPSRSPMTGSEQRLQNPSTSPSPSFHYIPREMLDQPRSDYPVPLDQPVNPESLMENPSKFQFTSAAPNNLDLDGLPKSVVSGTFWTFNKVDPIFPSPLPTEMAQPDSYLYGQVLYPHYLKGASQSFSGSDPYAQPGNMDGYHNNQINRLNDVSHTDGNKRYASGHLGSTNLRNHPEVDRVAASIFKNNHVFKRRYMDQLASTLFQKRYLDSLGSNLIKRGGTSSAADTAQDAINFSSDKIRSKRFTMKSSDFLHHKYDINQHISMLKRYIDSIASDLLYKRGPMAPGPSARSLRRSLQVHPGRPEELVIPSMSMESRLRSFQPETAPKGKKLSTSARAFVRRPALSKAMLLTEEAANDVTAPRTYYSQSLNDYVRDVTDQVLTRAKAKESQKLNRGMSGINFVKPGMLSKTKASWKKTENEASEDFFDSVAGALLK